ncbi:glycosyltransferase family 2 protein [Kribbella sp. NPDC006257]|uniref:glycosyltransferase family 2 protein n=1 Tax=Kribbella sp. NPDC006257 TaxID=3156738 RepID=UPI0033A4BEAE
MFRLGEYMSKPPASHEVTPGSPFGLTVVVPCLNEADNIEAAYDEIRAELGAYDELEILFVDDGSTDATLANIRALAERDKGVSYLSFTRNFGLEAAFSAGYRYARNPWLLHLDADLQFPPAEAHLLIECARTEGMDAVFGIRVDRQDRLVRRAGSALHDLIARRVLGIEIPAGGSSFRLVRSDLARRIVDLGLGTPYFLATLPRLTRSWTTVPVRHQPRRSGEAKVTVRGLARHAIELFVSFSTRTIALAAMLCLLAAVAAVGGAVAAAIPGGLPVTGVLLGLAAAAGLISLAVIARYLVHVGRGQPQTPQFLIRETNLVVRSTDLLAALPARTAAG